MATPAALGVILTLIMSSNYVELCDLYNLQSMGFVYFIIQYMHPEHGFWKKWQFSISP